MQQLTNRPFFLWLTVVAASIGCILRADQAFAATSIYVDGWHDLVANEAITLSLRVAPQVPINGVRVALAYDGSQLRLEAIDSAKSAFPVQLVQRSDNQAIHIERGILSSTIDHDALIANVRLVALTAHPSPPSISTASTSSGGTITPALTSNDGAPDSSIPAGSASIATSTSSMPPATARDSKIPLPQTDTISRTLSRVMTNPVALIASHQPPDIVALVVQILLVAGPLTVLWRHRTKLRRLSNR